MKQIFIAAVLAFIHLICLSQNVGIGTSSPEAKLDVRGTISLSDSSLYLRSGVDHNHGLNADDDVFREMPSVPPDTHGEFSMQTPLRGTNKDPFLDDGPARELVPEIRRDTEPETVNESDTGTVKPDARQIVEELNAIGALKSIWFEAGEKTPVGFAVFFRGPTELTRIRFEAVGHSREACASDVLKQVRRWQQENPEQ